MAFTPPPTDAIRQQLAKIAASRALEGSARLRDLLSYTVSQALAGHGDKLKESILGIEVFGRAPGYNSEASSIVRVEFARLRKKLEEYYGVDGIKDAVRISYPRGSYVPEFATKGEAAAFEGSVAVLPLVCGESEDDECLADGITDELITALSRVRGLKVVARTSSFAFKGKADDVREIGRVLKVNSVLEGSLRRNRDMVRVHVQLVDANDGCQLWAQKYERRITDVFEVQDEIATAIVNALKIEFPRIHRDRQPTSDPQAHALYLRGRYWWHRWNPSALRKAADFFQQAIERDPAYAAPYSGLADSYFLQGFWGYGRPRDLMPRAQAAVRQALPHIFDQFFFARGVFRASGNEGDHPLAKDRVGHADHSYFHDQWVLIQSFLDFLRREVGTAANDDFFLAPLKPVVAVAIAGRQVSGVQPAVAQESLSPLGIVPVSDAISRIPRGNLASFTVRHNAVVEIDDADFRFRHDEAKRPWPDRAFGIPDKHGGFRHTIKLLKRDTK